MAKICSAESAAGAAIQLETVKAKLISEGASALADGDTFLVVFNFVIEQGADSVTGVLQPLFEFHEKFVNAQIRRLRHTHFKSVCFVDDAWLRLSLIQAAYGCPKEKIKDDHIDYFAQGHVAAIMRSDKITERNLAMTLMMTFHRRYVVSGAYTHMAAAEKTHFLGRLGIQVGRCLLAREGLEFSVKSLAGIASTFEDELRKNMSDEVRSKLGAPLGGKAALAANSPQHLQPNVITFDSAGRARNAQDERQVQLILEQEVQVTDDDSGATRETKRCELFLCLHHAERMLKKSSCAGGKVKVVTDPERSGGFKVLATGDIAVGTLALVPTVPSPQSINRDLSHPDRVRTTIFFGDKEVCIAPVLRLPGKNIEGWVKPFWPISRKADDRACNCQIVHMNFTNIFTLGAGSDDLKLAEPRLVTDSLVMIPVCTNTAALAAGDELVMIHMPEAQKKAKDTGKRSRTWMVEAEMKNGKDAMKKK